MVSPPSMPPLSLLSLPSILILSLLFKKKAKNETNKQTKDKAGEPGHGGTHLLSQYLRGRWISEFKGILDYRVSSRTARGYTVKSCPKNHSPQIF